MRSQVRLVSDEHGDDVWACVLAQLFDPGLEVVKGRGFGHVIQQQHAKSSAIESKIYRVSAVGTISSAVRGGEKMRRTL
jgi:hypothetical protein